MQGMKPGAGLAAQQDEAGLFAQAGWFHRAASLVHGGSPRSSILSLDRTGSDDSRCLPSNCLCLAQGSTGWQAFCKHGQATPPTVLLQSVC